MKVTHMIQDLPDGFGGRVSDTKCGMLDAYGIYGYPKKVTRRWKNVTCKKCIGVKNEKEKRRI